MSASGFQIPNGVRVDRKRLFLRRQFLKGLRVVLVPPNYRGHSSSSWFSVFSCFMHDQDISIPKYMNGDMKLDIAKFQPAGESPLSPLAEPSLSRSGCGFAA
jgi:hypothetical protein